MRRSSLPFLLVAALVFGVPALAQPTLGQDSNEAHVTLGQSVIALTGPWKFHIGDDPRWADPNYNDSQWETVNFTPKSGSFDPVTGWAGYVPGWTAKGHPGYWGYAWYRIRVQVDNRPGETLALTFTANVDDAYQSFANGTLLGSFGKFPAHGRSPVTYYSQPMMFQLPQAQAVGPEVMVLALRVWMEPNTLQAAPDAGGFHNAPLLGDASAIEAGYQVAWMRLVRTYSFRGIEAVMAFLLAVLACSLILFDRSDPVYRWLAYVFLFAAVNAAVACLGSWSQVESIATATVATDIVLRPLMLGGWVMVWWAWFRLRRPAWMPRAIAVLTLLYILTGALGADIFFTVIPHPVGAAFHLASVGIRILFLLPLVLIVIEGVSEQGREGWLALPAVVLVGIAQFQNELLVLHVRTDWFPFGMQVTISEVANLVLVVVIFVLLIRRMLLSIRQQRQLALDVKQAQEVQQVLIPEQLPKVPGLTIESEYRPAREVGGDFFQILPHPSDGSVLIVAGDVTGKGLQAGMLVALIVGAIRATAQYDFDALAILKSLNLRLCGRGHAHATCLALHIGADGAATLANAGHLPPYLNGKAVTMEGALPLGIVWDAQFSVMRFNLGEGDRLMLVSDGIAEAMDAEGRLFGFDRVEEMLADASDSGPISAAALAAAAQGFGQADDISVIAITREVALSPVSV
jgi:serine phosphatase RsbU (regulator of sigma subunit)